MLLLAAAFARHIGFVVVDILRRADLLHVIATDDVTTAPSGCVCRTDGQLLQRPLDVEILLQSRYPLFAATTVDEMKRRGGGGGGGRGVSISVVTKATATTAAATTLALFPVLTADLRRPMQL